MALRKLRKAIDRQVRVYPLDQVSSRNRAAETDPKDVGLSDQAVRDMWGAIEALYQTGLYPAVALCVRRLGRVVIDGAIGHVRGNSPDDSPSAEKVVATPNTLFCLFSASKAITAMVVHLLDERRLIHLDDPVAEYIPEFARHGKEWVTMRHVLTHRSGIPNVPGHRVDVDLLSDPDQMISIICETKPVSAPGRRLAYHALTGGFVIAEVVRRVTGRDIQTVLREEILDPLGLQHMGFGVAPEERHRVAENAFTGPPALPPVSWLLRRALGVGLKEASDFSNDPRFLSAIIPAGNVVCTANEASRFYQLLLAGGELDGVRVFDPRTVKRAVAEQTYLELDVTLCLPVRYGMGFMLGTERLSIYGPDTGHAFGHLGFTNVVNWADPEREVAVCLMTSGKPLIHRGLLRWFGVMGSIARSCPKL